MHPTRSPLIDAGHIDQVNETRWRSPVAGLRVISLRTSRFQLLINMPVGMPLPRVGTIVRLNQTLVAAELVVDMAARRLTLAYVGVKPRTVWDRLARSAYFQVGRLAREMGMKEAALSLSMRANQIDCHDLPAIIPLDKDCEDMKRVLQTMTSMRQALTYARGVHASAASDAGFDPLPAVGGPAAPLATDNQIQDGHAH